MGLIKFLVREIAGKMTLLPTKLKQAGMRDQTEDFIKKTLFGSFYMSLGLLFIILMLMLSIESKKVWMLVPAYPILHFLMFSYMVRLPDIKILKKDRGISKEIVYAGRFLVIELESGVPLYDAFKNMKKNYPSAGTPFQEIVNKVDLGTPMEDAINETIAHTPSAHIRKILWQISNSMKTGSDASASLNAVMDQIVKEQIILIKEYGKKLNPLAMFYMMIAVIIPTLGTTMLVVLSSFIALPLSLTVLLLLVAGLGFMQFMFLNIIRSSRPPVEL